MIRRWLVFQPGRPASRALVAGALLWVIAPGARAEEPAWSGRGCTRGECHAGIEPIRRPASEMFRRIAERGRAAGDPDGCVVCHGGTPGAGDQAGAHRGAPAALTAAGGPDGFFADPASPWVNDRTCGLCHEHLVAAEWRSLMMTEAGKIQGTTWSFGSLEGYEHRWANYRVDALGERIGTDAYRAYMKEKAAAHPNVFVARHEPLPEAPAAGQLEELREHPEQSAFTYIRNQCQRCHLAVKGRQTRGDYRGMGCGACHVPYGNEGLYEGNDRTIPHDEPGHMLVHELQATRDVRVVRPRRGGAAAVEWTGIPVETCTTCHNRGKRIGVSYQGLMEAAWDTPYTEGGGGQLPLHTKHYITLSKDVHYQKGMLCQDCHTSGDVHGDGGLTGANLGGVEIECADCHGTPRRYPWELPLGWGDENGLGQAVGPARGVAREIADRLARGRAYAPEDGYLLTARGNPMPEVVRVGERVLVHTAGGRDLWLDPLKRKAERGELSQAARAAMVTTSHHLETMECYACHATWAPQCYGCHVKIDYSDGKRSFDWVAAGHRHATPAGRTVKGESTFDTYIPGQIVERRSYLRWEDPPLGVNGEGRVSPLMPGCQVSVTVIGKDGREIIRNKIFRTAPNTEGAGAQGQLGSDMSPVFPHTTGKARACESCHASAKALGYGIGEDVGVPQPWNTPKIVDLATADGTPIPRSARVQVEPIAGLDHDWSAVVTPEGRQLQTVGSHFEGSGPLPQDMRRLMDRRNVCGACHEVVPEGNLATSLLHHVAATAGKTPVTHDAHMSLLHHIVLTAATFEVGVAVVLALCFAVAVVVWWRRRGRDAGR